MPVVAGRLVNHSVILHQIADLSGNGKNGGVEYLIASKRKSILLCEEEFTLKGKSFSRLFRSYFYRFKISIARCD